VSHVKADLGLSTGKNSFGDEAADTASVTSRVMGQFASTTRIVNSTTSIQPMLTIDGRTGLIAMTADRGFAI
jgi:hypothetical protein